MVCDTMLQPISKIVRTKQTIKYQFVGGRPCFEKLLFRDEKCGFSLIFVDPSASQIKSYEADKG
jgi:hypothetical protein